jgi:hypothetical protein
VEPGIERSDGHAVHFVDGTVRTIDTIVYGTGLMATLPFPEPALLSASTAFPLSVRA